MTTVEQLKYQIGAGLKQARLASKKSIRGFCRDTDQEPNNYQSVETGRRTISLAKLATLADQHNCNVVIMIVSRDWNEGNWGNASSES